MVWIIAVWWARACVCVYAQNHIEWIIYIFMVIRRLTHRRKVLRKKKHSHTRKHKTTKHTAFLPFIIKPCKQVLEHGLSSLCNRAYIHTSLFSVHFNRRTASKQASRRREKTLYVRIVIIKFHMNKAWLILWPSCDTCVCVFYSWIVTDVFFSTPYWRWFFSPYPFNLYNQRPHKDRIIS